MHWDKIYRLYICCLGEDVYFKPFKTYRAEVDARVDDLSIWAQTGSV